MVLLGIKINQRFVHNLKTEEKMHWVGEGEIKITPKDIKTLIMSKSLFGISKNIVDNSYSYVNLFAYKGDIMRMDKLVDINKGFIRFESYCSVTGKNEVLIVPIATFSMKMAIIDEENGRYDYYFYDDGMEYVVDGATWLEAEEKLIG